MTWTVCAIRGSGMAELGGTMVPPQASGVLDVRYYPGFENGEPGRVATATGIDADQFAFAPE
jgi:hypothetical protein